MRTARIGCATGADAAEAGEEFVGGGYVFGDLGAKLFGAGEFLFFAKPLPEMDFDTRGADFGNRFEDMRFDAEGGAVERRPNADVGDRTARAGLAFKERACDVDPASGQEFLLGGEIQSRNVKRRPVPVPETTFPVSTNGRPRSRAA